MKVYKNYVAYNVYNARDIEWWDKWVFFAPGTVGIRALLSS
jgi:hypothetical protein